MIPEEFVYRFLIHFLTEKGYDIPTSVWKALAHRLEPWLDEVKVVNETWNLRICSEMEGKELGSWAFGTPVLRLYTI